MFRRTISAVVSLGVISAGLMWVAPGAAAAISGQTLTPTVWEVGSSPEATVTYSTDAEVVNPSIVVEWGWPVDFSPADDGIAAPSGNTYTCPTTGITFTASGGWNTTGTVRCTYASAHPDDPGTHRVTLVAANAAIGTVTVVFPAGQVTAAATATGQAIWTIGSGSTSLGQVRASLPAGVGVLEPPPPIRLEINGNGGVCTPSFVEGQQGTWGTAPTADKCTNGSRQLAFFSTSPTAAIGATNVRPGGPVFFFTANLLYAIWAPDKPSPVNDVVATPGLNSVKVTWKAPVSDGGAPINSYCIALRTEQNPNPFPRCLNAAQPLEFTFSLPATNSKYTPTVFARNSAGSSELVVGAPASPYDIKGVTASRKDVLLGLGGNPSRGQGRRAGTGRSVAECRVQGGCRPVDNAGQRRERGREVEFPLVQEVPAIVK